LKIPHESGKNRNKNPKSGAIPIKKLILLEDSDCISSLPRDLSQDSDEISLVSLTPQASYAMERAGFRYRTMADYCTSDKYSYQECERQGLENFKRIGRISEILDDDLHHFCTIPTLNFVQYSVYNLKFLLDGLWIVILRLKSIIEHEKPDMICLYTSKSPQTSMGRFAFSNDESLYAEVLLMDGWQIPVQVIRIKPSGPINSDPFSIPPPKNPLNSLLQNIDFMFNLGIIFKREGFVSTGNAFLNSLRVWHRLPVLIYNSGYNWDDSLQELYRQGISPVYRITDESVDRYGIRTPKYYDQILEICGSHPRMREFDQIFGIDVSDFFFHRLSEILEITIKESVSSYQFAKELIDKKKIRCLLLTTRERAMSYAIVQAARDAKIPVVSWQHGGGGYTFWPMIPFIEFFGSDVHVVFSERIVQNYLESSEKIGFSGIPAFFPAGSSSLDSIYKSNKVSSSSGRGKNIVYITTHYEKNLMFISHPFNPLAIDDNLWAVQKRMLRLAHDFPDNHFIIKLHSAHVDKEPLISYVNDNNLKNIRIISSEKSIADLIKTADLVIIDHITTGILQILTSDLPVFVYNGISKIDKEALASLKKRTYVHDDIDTLIRDLTRYIPDRTAPDPSVDRYNADFILKYGTDITRLNSAEKAVKKVRDLINNTSKNL
jgi:hypothetical protein